MSGFQLVFQLFLMLESLYEGLLGYVLGIRGVADYSVDLYEDAPQVIRNKTVLTLKELQTGLGDFAHLPANSFHRS
jgi:hypothetical protein